MKKNILTQILLSCIGILVFQVRSYGQRGGDSITHVDCPGADTVSFGMTVGDSGVIYYNTNRETGAFNTVTSKKILSTDPHSIIFKDNKNNFWQTQQTVIAKMNEKGKVLKQIASPSNYSFLNYKVNDMSVDKSNNLWIATNKGLLVKTESGWTRFDTKNSSLWSNNVVGLNIDSKNQKWIITDSGIDILGDTICAECSAWRTLGKKNRGIWMSMPRGVVLDKNSVIIGGAFGTILRIKDTLTDTLKVSKRLRSEHIFISSLTIDSFGNIWVGTWGNGLLKINPKGTDYCAYNSGNSSIGYNFINSVYTANDGTVYVGTSSKGIYKVVPTKYNYDNSEEKVEILKHNLPARVTNHISIYPNPSPGIFEITSTQEGLFEVKILSISGKIIKTLNSVDIGAKTNIDLSDLSAGTYILKIYSKSFTSSIKIILQK